MRRLLSILAISSAFLFSASAHATPVTLDFTLNIGGGGGTLSLTGVNDPFITGAIDVTAVTGTFTTPLGDVVNVTLFPIPGGGPLNSETTATDPLSGFTFDDVLLPGSAPFDFSGGLYLTDTAGNTYGFFSVTNPATVGGQSYLQYDSSGNEVGGAESHVNFPDLQTPSIPEPSTLALSGTGLLTMAGMARRKLFKR